MMVRRLLADPVEVLVVLSAAATDVSDDEARPGGEQRLRSNGQKSSMNPDNSTCRNAKRIRRVARIGVFPSRRHYFSLQGWMLLLAVMLCCSGGGPSCCSPSAYLSPPYYVCAAPMTIQKKRDDEKASTSSSGRKATASSKQVAADGMTLNQILRKAGKRGLGGGIPGAIAGLVQTLSLMWLRTIINYQYRYGISFHQAFVTLRGDGGIPRFYRGLSFALIQAPLSRFVSTAANDGVETLMESLDATRQWGPGRTTVVASIVVGFWRMMLMPVDTCKTVLQVDSTEGFRSLMRRVKQGKLGLLYQGAFANAISAILGHYPWFFVYNLLSKSERVRALVPSGLLRNAGTGFLASIVSDTVVNAIRVIKTTKQAIGAKHTVSYGEAVSMVLAQDGWLGLFGRGLKTRLLANALQSVMFTIIWRGLAERWRQDSTERHLKSNDHSGDELYGEGERLN